MSCLAFLSIIVIIISCGVFVIGTIMYLKNNTWESGPLREEDIPDPMLG